MSARQPYYADDDGAEDDGAGYESYGQAPQREAGAAHGQRSRRTREPEEKQAPPKAKARTKAPAPPEGRDRKAEHGHKAARERGAEHGPKAAREHGAEREHKTERKPRAEREPEHKARDKPSGAAREPKWARDAEPQSATAKIALPRDEMKEGYYWCGLCQVSLTPLKAGGHLDTERHRSNEQRLVKAATNSRRQPDR
jgi:hypothetical protein